jgi:hypothetical protein
MSYKNMKHKLLKSAGALIAALAILTLIPMTANAHCDTMDGPTVADGRKAMESNNVNYVLKWIQPDYEKEITDIFNLSMKVKDLSPEANEIAEKYFFGELVRIHRAGENAPFTGLKPSGTPIDEKVLAADESILAGNLTPFEGLMEEDKMAELTERFEKVMSLKNFDVDDVEAGREYIEAYVSFFKFAEGEEDGHHEALDAHANSDNEKDEHEKLSAEDVNQEEAVDNEAAETVNEAKNMPETGEKNSWSWLAWTLAVIFFISTIITGHKLKHKK